MPELDSTKSLADEEATLEYGGILAAKLLSLLATTTDGLLVYLQGDLGAGKTTLVRGMLRSLGHDGPVKSPTYTLVESYEVQGQEIHHFDLYRMEHPEELEFMGGREYLDSGLCLVEWPQKGRGWLPEPNLIIELVVQGNTRQISLDWQNNAA